MKNKNQNIEQPDNTPYSDDNRDDYIRNLEMSIQLLQREVEHLRNQAGPDNLKISDGNRPDMLRLHSLAGIFITCLDENSVLEIMHSHLSQDYGILESNFYFFDSEGRLEYSPGKEYEGTLTSHIKNYEEEGIIDWAVEQKKLSVVPNLEEEAGTAATNFIISPLILRDSILGIYFAKTTLDKSSIGISEISEIQALSGYAAISLDNIRSSREIKNMNRKLSALNQKMIRTSNFASIGELSSTIANEIGNTLKILDANIHLLESGVGDPDRRIAIIKEELKKIQECTTKLEDIYKEGIANKIQPINVCELIDQVTLLSGAQLQRNGIKIEKNYTDGKCIIDGVQSQLQQALLKIILFSSDLMPDGGSLNFSVYTKKRNISINIEDTGRGIPENALDNIFEPDYRNPDEGIITSGELYISKRVIEQHGGDIRAYSVPDQGTSFRITFPGNKEF